MKKGFTLIELLAVIVILAIIALIATPIVLNIINDTKKSATIRGAEFYIDALENAIMLENMKTGGTFNPNVCQVTNKVISCDGKELTLKVDGEVPTSGSITFEEGKVKDVNLTYKSGTVTQNNKGELVLGELQEQQLAPGLYDENDNLLISWSDLTSTEYKSITYDEYEGNSIVAILNLDENGVLTSAYSYFYDDNYSAEYLVGKLVLDESVTSIGAEAFKHCNNLTSIIIPDSVISMGVYAFEYCDNLESITIPDSLTYMGAWAFSGCTSLTKVTIGSNVKAINEYAFCGCTSLTSITIPESVVFINDWAFADCTSLESIIILSSKTSVQLDVFSGCENLTTIYYNNLVDKETLEIWGAPNARVESF